MAEGEGLGKPLGKSQGVSLVGWFSKQANESLREQFWPMGLRFGELIFVELAFGAWDVHQKIISDLLFALCWGFHEGSWTQGFGGWASWWHGSTLQRGPLPSAPRHRAAAAQRRDLLPGPGGRRVHLLRAAAGGPGLPLQQQWRVRGEQPRRQPQVAGAGGGHGRPAALPVPALTGHSGEWGGRAAPLAHLLVPAQAGVREHLPTHSGSPRSRHSCSSNLLSTCVLFYGH